MSWPTTLTFDDRLQALRGELRAWIAANDPGPRPVDFDPRVRALAVWQRQLHAAGFIGLSWPEEFGGHGLGISGAAVLCEALARSGLPELLTHIPPYPKSAERRVGET